MNQRNYLLACLGIVLAGTAGCGSADDENPNAPRVLNVTKGTITMNGKDIVHGAIVTFHPKAGGATGQLISGIYQNDEGCFFLSTDEGRKKVLGAPEGEYMVTIQPPARYPTAIPAKYANPATSGLTAVIKSGMNQIPEMKLTP